MEEQEDIQPAKRKKVKRPRPFNDSQRQVIKVLLDGGNLVKMGVSGIRIRDDKNSPVGKITEKSMYRLKDLLKKHRNQWIIKRSGFQLLNGNHWAKRYYKKWLELQKTKSNGTV